MSLEGGLSNCRFEDAIVIAREELGVLKRNTWWPKQDFVVLLLRPDTVGPIHDQIMAAGLSRVFHIQIEQDGEILIALTTIFTEIALSPAQKFQLSFSRNYRSKGSSSLLK